MAQSGGIYKWQHFNGTNNRFVLPFSVSGAYTLEAIANTDSVASSEVLMGYGLTTSSPYPGVAVGISAVSNALFIGNSNNEKALSPLATYVTVKTSHWWSDVYGSNTSLLFYLDGINYTSSLSNVNYFNDANGYYTIGARYYLGNYSLFWKGCIDEVRISSGVRNASWMKTCYNNENNPASFYSLGSQEHVPSASNPPVFGTPTPTNGSTNNPISFTWSIPINDPEGNLFSWTIQCSNKQGNIGTGATNGTKILALSGLAYLTTYKVWVNATDPAPAGSGQWTKRWYTFTTMSQPWVNRMPTFSNPSPANGSTAVNRYHATNVTVSDLDGNSTLVCLWYGSSISGPWTKVQQNNSVVANTTVKDVNSSYSSGWSTLYWWRVTAYDGHVNSSVVYTFMTPQQNIPPNKPNKPSGNNSGKIKIVYTYTTSTTDPNGDQVYYMWDWGDGNNSGWLGPYSSGVTASVTHKWAVKGSYSIKVKAKDIKGAESGWSDPLSIKMPYSFDKPIFQFLNLLFQRFPHIFPIIRHIVRY
jgi:hypothetical protein